MLTRSALLIIWNLIATTLLLPQAQATMMIRAMSLEEVTAEAERVVHAKVVSVLSGQDASGLPATWVTLEVNHNLKGSSPQFLTIKQFGTTKPLSNGSLARVPGLPRYAVGEELVLFLRGESARGFTSPVGIGQGVYRVEQSDAGASVRNDLGRQRQSLDSLLSTVTRLSRTE